MAHRITLIPGDGIGPEVSAAAQQVVQAAGVEVEWDVQAAGATVMEREGTPLPDRVLRSIVANRTALKGPITTPVGTGFRSVNVALRQELDLFANVRPCRTYPGVRSRYEGVDIVIVRENTEDLYAGVEFEQGTEQAAKLIDILVEMSGQKIRPDSAIGIKPISIYGSQRIVKYAFDYARQNRRKKVTAVHKANI